eukprot:COSAG01_NODE_34686_length_543_cov_2.322072_1_plen_150_part_01
MAGGAAAEPWVRNTYHLLGRYQQVCTLLCPVCHLACCLVLSVQGFGVRDSKMVDGLGWHAFVRCSDTTNNRLPRDSPTNQTPAQVLRSGCHALFIEPPTATDALQVPVAAPAINGNKQQFQWQTGEEAQEEGYWTQSESCGSIGIWAWGL